MVIGVEVRWRDAVDINQSGHDHAKTTIDLGIGVAQIHVSLVATYPATAQETLRMTVVAMIQSLCRS